MPRPRRLAYLGDPDGVSIEGTRVVNRLQRSVEVSITVQCPPQGAGLPDCVETLSRVAIPARGFIDFAAYDARPLFVLSAFADEADIMYRLQTDGDYCTPGPPPDLGPWTDSEIPGVRFTRAYIHNENPHSMKIVAVCACENEAGNARCVVFNGAIPGCFLDEIKSSSCMTATMLLVELAELRTEAAALRTAFMADVDAGRMTLAEAEDLLAFEDNGERIIEDTVRLIAVVRPGRSRQALRRLYEQVGSKASAG